MQRAFVFPGQGSQSVGMGQDLSQAFAAARAVFEEIDEALGERLSTTIFAGPDEELRLTRNAQPALMATSMAFEHPFTQESVTIEAPIPARLQRVFDRFSWPAPKPWRELNQPEVIHA